MLLDWDTFWSSVLVSHVPTGCVLAQVAVSNDWHPRAPGGCPPGFNPFNRGWFYHLVPLFRGIFGTAGHMWVSVLRPDPPKKRPSATLVCLVGAYNKYIKMSHKIRAIRDNTSLNVIKRNRKKLAGRIKRFKKDKQGKHIGIVPR